MTWNAFLYSLNPLEDARRLQGAIVSLMAYLPGKQIFLGQAREFRVATDCMNHGKLGLCCTVNSENWEKLQPHFLNADVTICAGDFRYLYAA